MNLDKKQGLLAQQAMTWSLHEKTLVSVARKKNTICVAVIIIFLCNYFNFFTRLRMKSNRLWISSLVKYHYFLQTPVTFLTE